MKLPLRLIHWHPAEAAELARRLATPGFAVEADLPPAPILLCELARGLARAVRLGTRMPVWVVSPKKTGPLAGDVSQNDIRAACLQRGLVDYKVCAVDSTWSGLLFRRRR